MYVNEEGNSVADKAVEVAVTYVSKNPKVGVKVELQRVVGNRTDAKGLLESRNHLENYYLQIILTYHIVSSM